MLSINMEDVKSVLLSCRPYLIFFGIVLLLVIITIIVSFTSKKISKLQKYLLRTQAFVVAIIGLIVTLNLVALKPVATLLDLASGKGSITKESIAEANKFGVQVADEGIILLKNDSELLPLTKDKKINVFGWASTNPCYGGSGSGGISDKYKKVSILDSLKDAGFSLNTQLSDFYTKYRAERPSVNMFVQDWTLPEPPVKTYSSDLLSTAEKFSDTALIVLARTGCENADLPTDLSKVTYTDNSKDYKDFGSDRHYLELSRSEENLVKMVCSKFNNVVVVYNGSSAFELNFCNKYKQIKSLIWCPGAGQTGFEALGKILDGEINPSGKTTDIIVKDLTKTPTYNNFMISHYDNMQNHAVDGVNFATGKKVSKTPSFIDYVEGIYVGYRFYETAATEGFINYNDYVQYPFGYGLSYTNFSQKMGQIIKNTDGSISFDVTVTNTGSKTGKDIVEVYFNPPYTNGGIEKSSANLIAYQKTQAIEPGKSEIISINFKKEDMASFDTYGEGCYVLDAGNYGISIRSDSHTIIDEQIYSIPEKIVYNKDNPRSSDKTAAVDEFKDVEGDVTYLSRANHFANYAKAVAAPASFSMSKKYMDKYLDNTNYKPENYNDSKDIMPTTGADNNVKLAELRGMSYNDPKWNSLLDELSVNDMSTLISLGGYQTAAIKKIGKIATLDCDGPVDIYNNFTGESSVGLPSIVMLASSWNTNIATDYGKCIGKMADEMNVSGWYAPSMNMHRSAFAGRNFEYYSEDGTLAGITAAHVVRGASSYGVYSYIKHFAMNDQETDRWYKNSVWSNEQAIREIYLKPFEIAVKQGHAQAVMSSYNYIGCEWDGACSSLLQKVLRDEWGFHGMVITDYFLALGGSMNADQAIRNGSDLMLTNINAGTNNLKDTTSATGVLAMRNASHNILYTIVNSRAYSNDVHVTKGLNWRVIMIIGDIVLLLLLFAFEIFIVKNGVKNRRK